MDRHASRRGFMAAAGMVAAASVIPPATADAAGRATASRLQRAIALHDRVDAECERFDAEVEMPARQAWAMAMEAHREIGGTCDRSGAIPAAQALGINVFTQESRRVYRIDALEARSGALANRRYRLWWLAVTAPAGSLDDVATKLAFVERTRGNDVDGDVLAAVAVDVRRLAAGA